MMIISDVVIERSTSSRADEMNRNSHTKTTMEEDSVSCTVGVVVDGMNQIDDTTLETESPLFRQEVIVPI